MFGLTEYDVHTIKTILSQYKDIEAALIFGSRAMGNYKRGSDVDIALKGTHLQTKSISDIRYELNEETFMPYYFDIVNYQTIKNKDLIEHIDRVGLCFFEK